MMLSCKYELYTPIENKLSFTKSVSTKLHTSASSGSNLADFFTKTFTKTFHNYLIGDEFQVHTDSNLLSEVMMSKRSTEDMSKLAEINAYNFSIIYRNGRNHRNVML